MRCHANNGAEKKNQIKIIIIIIIWPYRDGHNTNSKFSPNPFRIRTRKLLFGINAMLGHSLISHVFDISFDMCSKTVFTLQVISLERHPPCEPFLRKLTTERANERTNERTRVGEVKKCHS